MKYTSMIFRYLLFLQFLFIYSKSVDAQAVHPIIIWQKSLGGSSTDEAQAIALTKDSGYVVSGYSASTDGDVTGVHGSQYDYWVVKLSSNNTIQWEKSFGGTAGDLSYSIKQTKDKGYIIAGYSYSNDIDVSGNHGSADYSIIKLDDTGKIQWQRSLGGSDVDIANCVQETSDSGFIIAGRSFSTDGDIVSGHHDSADCWIVKLSATGSTQWQKSLGGKRGDGAYSIQQTMDTGYIVACSSASTDGDVTGNHGDYDIWIVKISSVGGIQWEKSFGGSGADYAGSIQQTHDTGYIVLGSTNSVNGDVTKNHGGFDYWILKLSSSGIIQWQKTFGGSRDDFGTSIKSTLDSGYIVVGTTFSDDSDITSNHGQSDIWAIKLSSSGSIKWQKTFGGSSYDGGESVQQDIDSNYIIAGYSSSNDSDVTGYHGGTDYWVIKIGNPLKIDTSIIDTNRTSINKETQVATFLISPNPATTQLKISSSQRLYHLAIINLFGKTVYSTACNTDLLHIDISNLPDGIYFAKINNVETRIFIKKQ